MDRNIGTISVDTDDYNNIELTLNKKTIKYNGKPLNFRSYYIGKSVNRRIKGVKSYNSDYLRYISSDTVLNNEISLRELQLINDIIVLSKLYKTRENKKSEENKSITYSLLNNKIDISR